MTFYEWLQAKGEDFANHDLAVLADWANEQKKITPADDWKRAFALIREGADLLLRRRARAACVPPFQRPIADHPLQEGVMVDYLPLRRQINDFTSIFYGPHACRHCGVEIVRQAHEQGGLCYERRLDCAPEWVMHGCDPNMIEARPQASNATAGSMPSPGI